VATSAIGINDGFGDDDDEITFFCGDNDVDDDNNDVVTICRGDEF
jgi:hypothetical protein